MFQSVTHGIVSYFGDSAITCHFMGIFSGYRDRWRIHILQARKNMLIITNFGEAREYDNGFQD